MRTRSDVIAALSAAVRRVYPNIAGVNLEKEVGWALVELGQVGLLRDLIPWHKLTIGRLLFNCLGEAQNWRCCWCGVRTLEHYYKRRVTHPSFEHVVPVALEGPDHPDNMTMACVRCNQGRGRELWELLNPGLVFIPRNQRRA